MKAAKIIFWVSTILFVAFMLFSGVMEIINNADSQKLMTSLGYPNYLSPFLGVTKILGALVIIIPGFPKLKEWAYAGFVIDFVGAGYSFAKTNQPQGVYFLVIMLIVVFVSYFSYHRKMKASA